MKLLLKDYKTLISFTIPIMLLGVLCFFAVSSSLIPDNSLFYNALTIDFLFTIPVIYYFLTRKSSIPKFTIMPFLIAGILIGSFVIPSQNQGLLSFFKTWLLPLIEFAIVGFIGYKVYITLKLYKKEQKEATDFYSALKKVCIESFPSTIAMLLATEGAVFYYAFIRWKRKPLSQNEFTYHKNSGTISLLIGILLVIAVETVVLHVLLAKWSVVIAWIISGVSIYSGFQIFGFLKTMILRPIKINDHGIQLCYGITSEASILFDNIECIELSSKEIELKSGTIALSFLKNMEPHNILISLKTEATYTGLYGIKKKYKKIVFHVDEKESFVTIVKQKLSNTINNEI